MFSAYRIVYVSDSARGDGSDGGDDGDGRSERCVSPINLAIVLHGRRIFSSKPRAVDSGRRCVQSQQTEKIARPSLTEPQCQELLTTRAPRNSNGNQHGGDSRRDIGSEFFANTSCSQVNSHQSPAAVTSLNSGQAVFEDGAALLC